MIRMAAGLGALQRKILHSPAAVLCSQVRLILNIVFLAHLLACMWLLPWQKALTGQAEPDCVEALHCPSWMWRV